MDERLIAFIGVAVAVVVIPGPDMALVARNVIRGGRSEGFATSLGICTGILGWGLAAVVGISTLLATSATAFTVLKLAGAGYLIWLGISTLRARDDLVVTGAGAGERAFVPWRTSYLQGLVSALLNPKLGVFFLTLLPQFVDPGPAAVVRSLQLAALFDAIGLVWLLAYSAMLAALGAALGRPGPRRAIRRLTGTILVGLGARVALERG
jgi:threonine/homoserine/homoserine lactone efflux protein